MEVEETPEFRAGFEFAKAIGRDEKLRDRLDRIEQMTGGTFYPAVPETTLGNVLRRMESAPLPLEAAVIVVADPSAPQGWRIWVEV